METTVVNNDSFNIVLIENCVVSKWGNGTCVFSSLRIAKKTYPDMNIESLPRITYGTRMQNHKILSRLSEGTLNWEDFIHKTKP